MPFTSCPKGGTPPAPMGRKQTGGKPSVSDAAPGVMLICDASGIGRTKPAPAAFANGMLNLAGIEAISMRASPARRPLEVLSHVRQHAHRFREHAALLDDGRLDQR